MYTNLSKDNSGHLIRMAKENGWKIEWTDHAIILSKGRSTIECPDRRSAVEYLMTKNV